jgi:hypothetical protein
MATNAILEALASENNVEVALESLWRNESVHQIAQKLKWRRCASDDETTVVEDRGTVSRISR